MVQQNENYPYLFVNIDQKVCSTSKKVNNEIAVCYNFVKNDLELAMQTHLIGLYYQEL